MEMTDVVTQSEEETMKLCERLVRFCFPQAVVTALNPRGVVTADFGSYSMTYSLAGHFSAIELVELSEKAVVLRDLKEEYGEALLDVLGLMGRFLMADYAYIATIALASQEVRLKALKKVLDGLPPAHDPEELRRPSSESQGVPLASAEPERDPAA